MAVLGNLIAACFYLAFVVMDILTVIILLEVIQRIYHTKWLEPVLNETRPILDAVLVPFKDVSYKTIGRQFTESQQLIMLLVLMMIVRLIITAIF